MQTPIHSSAAAVDTKLYTTRLNTQAITANNIVFGYSTIPGNLPNAYGNFVSVWQNVETIPFTIQPIIKQEVTSNTEQGSVVLNFPVLNTSYLAAYSVGPTLEKGQPFGNVCSTVYIPPAGSGSSILFSPSLRLDDVTGNAVAFNYSMPAGITPMDNGAWCGIWPSAIPSYHNPPEKIIPVNSNSSQDSLVFEGYPIRIGYTYTIAYFMSGYNNGSISSQTAMACSITFSA